MQTPETLTARVWLVRHGESDWNRLGLAQGQAAAPVLTPVGTAQCERAARRLAGRPISALLSSDLQRARQSATIIAGALSVPVIVEPALRERALGLAEGRPAVELGLSSGVRAGRVEDPDVAPEGGESVSQLYERVTRFFGSLVVAADADTVVVTHGGVIRVLLAWARRLGPHDMCWPAIPNGAVVPYVLPRPTSRGVHALAVAGRAGR